jgi:AcrR family transcriptional regulator
MKDENANAATKVAAALELAEGKLPPKKRKLVEAAVLCFAENGFSGTSTRQIADRAGVAEATIFRHFGTKQELLIRLVTPVLDQLMVPELSAQERDIIAGMTDLKSMMRWMMLNRIEFARRYQPLVRILLQDLPVNDELRTVVMEHLAEPISRIALGQLARLTGTLTPDDPNTVRALRVVASALLGYIIGRLIVFPQSDWDDAEEVEVMVTILCDGILHLTRPER